MRITTITPLHIGTGEEIPDFEYEFDSSSGQLLRFSLNRLLAGDSVIAENPDLVSTPENLRHYLLEKDWMQYQLYALDGDAQQFHEYRSRDRTSRLAPVVVKEVMKSAYHCRALVPGSSLKGALLTGWYFGRLLDVLSEEEYERLFDDQDQSFEHNFSVIYNKLKRQRQQIKNTPEEALFKFLDSIFRGQNPEWDQKKKKLLSDRLSIPDVELSANFSIRFMQRQSSSGKNALPFWVECVQDSTVGNRPARLKKEISDGYTLAEICRRSNLFAKALLAAERQFFNFSENGYELPAVYEKGGIIESNIIQGDDNPLTCVIRLGWASNKNATSITLLNSASDISEQPDYRSRKLEDRQRRRPLTRWLTHDNVPLGWCRLEFVKDEQIGEDRHA